MTSMTEKLIQHLQVGASSPSVSANTDTEAAAVREEEQAQALANADVRFFFNGFKVNGGTLHKAHLSLIEGWTHSNGRIVPTHIALYCNSSNSMRFAPEVGALFAVENNTDSASDYFDDDKIRISIGHHLFGAALAAYLKGVERDIRRCDKYGKNSSAANYRRDADRARRVATEAGITLPDVNQEAVSND